MGELAWPGARGFRVRGCAARGLRRPTLSTLWPRLPGSPPISPTSPTSPTGPTGPTSFHLLRYPSFVDKNRRYVSLSTPRRRRVQKMRSCDVAFCGNATTLLIGQLESGSAYRRFLSKASKFQERKRGDRLALAETLRKQSCSMADEVQACFLSARWHPEGEKPIAKFATLAEMAAVAHRSREAPAEPLRFTRSMRNRTPSPSAN